MKKFVSPLPGLRILLTVLLVLLACQPGRANDGYWVLDKASSTGGGGSKVFQFKVTKTSATVVSTGSANGTTFTWPDLPEKIKFGDEAKLGFPVQINCPDPATARLIQRAKMMSLTVTVSMWDPYECRDYTTLNNPFQWRTEVTGSGTVSRLPNVDMHEELFTPTSESTLTISVVASLNTPITVDGKAVSGLSGGRTYVYKYVGDKPIYGIETEGTDKPGEFGKTEIPPALFWIGGAVVGIIGVNQIRKNRKKNKKGGRDPEPEEEEPKKNPSTFRMILYKEFGDTLYAGGEPKVVGARIEEQTRDGRRIDRADLSRMIRIVEGRNIQLLSTGFNGRYQCGTIQVPEPKQADIPAKGSVIFHFETPTGILQNEVVFFIEDNKKILFTQDNITFVAGQNNTETVYFYVLGLGKDPVFEVSLENDEKQTFAITSHVRPDKEGSWSVDLKDCLTDIPEQMAGNMDNCHLAVTAKEYVRDGERKVTERLPVHRFYEGLRMEVGHVKAYAVVEGTETINRTEELPKSQNQLLKENQSLKGPAGWDESQLAVVPAHTRLELTLFAWNKEKNMIGSPSPQDVSVVFEDVTESLEWFGKKGAEITEPVRALGFNIKQFGIDSRPISQHSDIQGCTTTFVYEIIPTAIMLPPNRCKVAITATASYDGRTFEAKQTSMVISMPMRYAPDAESMDNLIKFDAQVHDRLVMMITKLTSLTHAPQFKALIYKCQLLIDSFDERFGFYMPDYYQARDLYLRTMRGEIGPLYVAEHAYNWEEVHFGDFFNMCMATYEKYEPKTFLGRVLLGVVTLGYSEIIYYTPKRFLLECRNAAYENPDSDFFSNFTVGAKFAYMEALDNYRGKVVLGYAAGKLSSSQFGQALKEMAHEVHRDIRSIERSLCKNYSSVRFVYRLGRSGRKLAQMKLDGRLLGFNKLNAGKAMVNSSANLKGLKELEIRAQKLGEAKVKKFIKACDDPNISEKELKELVLSIQCDRWAKNYMNTANVIDKYRFRFTMENTILHENVKKALKAKLARQYGVHESEITFFEATGNATKVNAANCRKVGMDHDYTIRVRGKDLPEEVASRYWNDEYCYQATGSKNFSPWDADKLAAPAEQTAVSATGPESFGTDVDKVVHPKETALDAFDDPELVRKVQTHKVKQELDAFERCMEEASNSTDPRWKEVYQDEAMKHLHEATRQFPKGADRTLESKLEVIDEWGQLDKLDADKVRAAYELRGRAEEMLSRHAAGDHQAVIDMYASYKVEGKSMAVETEKAFSLIPEVDRVIQEGPELPDCLKIHKRDIDRAIIQSAKGGIEEASKEDVKWF